MNIDKVVKDLVVFLDKMMTADHHFSKIIEYSSVKYK